MTIWELENPSSPASQSEVERLLAALRDLASLSRRVDMLGFEEQPAAAIRDQLFPMVLRLGGLSLHIIRQLQPHYELPDENGSTGPTDPNPETQVGDVLFVAMLQLGQALDELRLQRDLPDHWDLIGQCNRFRGVVIAVAAACGRAVCKHEGWANDSGPSAIDLRQSLLIRRAYVAFHQSVHADGEPEPQRIGERLVELQGLIKRLLASSIAKQIRVNDRCHFRRLLEKIDLHLSNRASDPPEEGVRLWQDVRNVAEILVQINNRQELVEHDREAAERLLQMLAPGVESLGGSGSLLSMLSEMHGRDPDLDRAIHLTELTLQRHLLPQLRELIQRL